MIDPVDLAELSDRVEQISAGYAERFGIDRSPEWYLLKLHEELGELTQCFLKLKGQARTAGDSPEDLEAAFRAEVADVLCHVVLLARHHGVDLDAEVAAKWLVWAPAPTG
jgi:NTP pyrophosphatase (non-canonical NTP hydrolase)